MPLPPNIKKIFIPRFDAIGDIILLEGFIEALLDKYQDAEITLIVREGHDQLKALFPDGINWISVRLNPYEAPMNGDIKELSMLLNKLADHRSNLLLITTYNRTWIDDAIACKLEDTYSIAIGELKEIKGWFERLYKILNLKTKTPYNEVVPVRSEVQETDKYQVLWNALFSDSGKLLQPRLTVTKELELMAGEVLSKMGLIQKSFFICFPAGTMNIPIKAWSADRFAEIISWVNKEYSLPVLLAGHEDERKTIDGVAKMVQDKTNTSPSVWLGKDGQIPLFAALVKEAHLYLGNDTGPLHIAAAVGTPAVGIFGGGHWPRFLPVGPHSIGLAAELPCFGCAWDCIFEDAPCTSLVKTEDVRKAIKMVLKGGVESNILRSDSKVTAETGRYIKKAVDKFRRIKSDLTSLLEEAESNSAARLEQVNDLTVRLKESEADGAARFEQINNLTGTLKELVVDCASRYEQIQDLTGILKESEVDRASRFEQINDLTGVLKESEVDRAARFEQINDLTRMLKESEADRASRFRQIHDLTGMLKESEADCASRFEQINDLTGMLKESEADRLARFDQIVELTRLAGELNEHLNITNGRLDIIQKNRIYALLKKIKLMP